MPWEPYHLNTVDVEEAVSALLSRPAFGLDAVNRVIWLRGDAPHPFHPAGRPAERRGCTPHLTINGALGRAVYWFRAMGVLRRGREWDAAANCRATPPIAGWRRVPAEAVAEALKAHLRASLWAYWPPGRPTGHTLVFGATGTGKTTLVKAMLLDSPRYVVIDLTGEYAEWGRGAGARVAVGSISLAEYGREDLVRIYLWAVAGALGEEASLSAVQWGMLQQLPLHDPAAALAQLRHMRPELSAAVLAQKLSALCAEYREGLGEVGCAPWPQLTRPAPPAQVYDVSGAPNQLVAAMVTYGILLSLFRRGLPTGTAVVVDEYHRIAPRAPGVEDIVEAVIREGRKRGIRLILVSQAPGDVKPALRGVVHSVAYFRLYGEAAAEAARTLNVPPHVVESLPTGRYLAITPEGPRRAA